MNQKNKSFVFVWAAFVAVACILSALFVTERVVPNWEMQCVYDKPLSSAFYCHIPVSSASIYPRLDLESIPKFPCHDRTQDITACFVDELLAIAPTLMARGNYIDYLAKYAFQYATPLSLKKMIDELKVGGETSKNTAVFVQAASGDIHGSVETLKSIQSEGRFYPAGQLPQLYVTSWLRNDLKDIDKTMAFITASQSIKFKIDDQNRESTSVDKSFLYHVMKDLINGGREKEAERFAAGIKADNIFIPGKSGNQILAGLRKETAALKNKNRDVLEKIPAEIGGSTIDSFKKSVSLTFDLLRQARDFGFLTDAREVLRNVTVVLPEQKRDDFSASLLLHGLFNFAGLPDRERQYELDDSRFDLLARKAEIDHGKAIFDFLDGYKTEAERGYHAAAVLRSLLKLKNPDFELVKELWPPAIAWCMQRNVDADIGRPVMGFFHDEDRPNTYPACLIQLLPDYRFYISGRGH